jgi:hypothetical protein
MNQADEIGRPLKVSELVPETVVITHKDGRNAFVTMWVIRVSDDFVWFTMGDVGFIARRTGPDKEALADDTGTSIMIYEYLGEV